MNFFIFASFFRYVKWKIIFKKLKETKLLILDVDGVLTTGLKYYDTEGNVVSKTFGDIESKLPSLGGIEGVISPEPDITIFPIDDDLDYALIACKFFLFLLFF